MLPRTADQEPHSANPCPGSALSEKAHFPQYWPFWSNSRRTAVNQKRLEFVVEMFGSPAWTRFELSQNGTWSARTAPILFVQTTYALEWNDHPGWAPILDNTRNRLPGIGPQSAEDCPLVPSAVPLDKLGLTDESGREVDSSA
jgi:hypothetical protein